MSPSERFLPSTTLRTKISTVFRSPRGKCCPISKPKSSFEIFWRTTASSRICLKISFWESARFCRMRVRTLKYLRRANKAQSLVDTATYITTAMCHYTWYLRIIAQCSARKWPRIITGGPSATRRWLIIIYPYISSLLIIWSDTIPLSSSRRQLGIWMKTEDSKGPWKTWGAHLLAVIHKL